MSTIKTIVSGLIVAAFSALLTLKLSAPNPTRLNVNIVVDTSSEMLENRLEGIVDGKKWFLTGHEAAIGSLKTEKSFGNKTSITYGLRSTGHACGQNHSKVILPLETNNQDKIIDEFGKLEFYGDSNWTHAVLQAIDDFGNFSRFPPNVQKKIIVLLASPNDCEKRSRSIRLIRDRLKNLHSDIHIRFIGARLESEEARELDEMVKDFGGSVTNVHTKAGLEEAFVKANEYEPYLVKGTIPKSIEPIKHKIALYVHLDRKFAESQGCFAGGWYGPKPRENDTHEIHSDGSWSAEYVSDRLGGLSCDHLADRIAVFAIPKDYIPKAMIAGTQPFPEEVAQNAIWCRMVGRKYYDHKLIIKAEKIKHCLRSNHDSANVE